MVKLCVSVTTLNTLHNKMRTAVVILRIFLCKLLSHYHYRRQF
nr:MAG TPA: hypothetical protein [Caudoviricetes sp.]